MAELKILLLFLITFSGKKELRCNALDIAPQDPVISTKLPSDNELTHVHTKNLSGNVKLTTLELLTTNTPFDDLNNASEVISEGTTSENKHSEIEPVIENGQEDVLLLSSEIGTKAPTDGFEPLALMDVFNSTSGTFPDQNSTEKLITVTPLNKLIDEDFDITTSNEANTETTNNIEYEFIDKVTRATRDFEENEEMTQNYTDIEDLATFMKLDEEFLNTVTDRSEELEYLNETIEEISSILNSYEDKSPSLEENNSETKKQTYFEATTKELLKEETENNEEYVEYEDNLMEKSTIRTHFANSSTQEDRFDDDKPNISIEEESSEKYDVNSQTTISTVTATEESQFIISTEEEEENEMKKEGNFETTTTTFEDNSISKLSVEEENTELHEDEINYETTTTINDLNEENEEISETTTTVMNIEEEYNEMKKEKYFETTTTNEIKFIEKEDSEEYQEKMTYDITTITDEDLVSEEYEINTLITYETTTISYQQTTINDSEIKEENNKEYTDDNLTNFEANITKEVISEVNENISSIMNSSEDKLIFGSTDNEEVRVEEGETSKDYSLPNSFEDKSLEKGEKYKEINLGTPSTEETTAEYVIISGRFAEVGEDLNNTTEEVGSDSDSFSVVTEELKINEFKEETTENYVMSSMTYEEDTTISTRKIEITTTSITLNSEDVQVGTTENLNIYDKVDNEEEDNATEDEETQFDNFTDVTEEFKIKENNEEGAAENDGTSSKNCEEDTTISTRKIERTTTSIILNTEDVQVGTTEKSDIYEKIDNREEVEDKLTINIDINELEKIEEAMVREINEIEEEDLKEIEGTSFYNITESTTNYESKEIFISTTVLSFLKPDGYNQVITTAEMLKTEFEKVEEPQISFNISGRKQHFSVKIVYNESAFFVPSDALLTVQPPNFLNITWKAPSGEMNNSIELNFGKKLQLNLVKDNQMHVHKTALICESKDKLSDTNLITLEEGIQIYFSNISFLKTDENGPGTLRRNDPMRTLAGEIVGSCIGACILIGIVVYFLAKKFRSKTRNFKPNGDA